MFSGIVQAIGTIRRGEKRRGSFSLKIIRPKNWRVRRGDSVAVDGVCLTISKLERGMMTFSLMPETLWTTKFGKKMPAYVNLEPSLRTGDTLGGHLVGGHVDTVGEITKIDRRGMSRVLRIEFPKKFMSLVVPKGSITIDGVSLTIVDAKYSWCTASLVEHTLRHTTLGKKKKGDFVNIEFDIIAKYVAGQIRRR